MKHISTVVCKVGNLLWLLQLFLSERVVIQYVGAPVCPVPAAHGNSRTNRPFIRTKPSVLAKIKEAVEVTAGHAAPAKMYKDAIRNDNTDDPRACPRNIKQVHVMYIYLVIVTCMLTPCCLMVTIVCIF